MNSRTIIINIVRWVLLLFVQVFLLKNMGFYDLSTPFIYVLFLLLLPFNIPNILLYIIAFGTGLTLDAFYDTMGVHATACVVLAFVRISFIAISLNKDAHDDPEPSLSYMGFQWFALYSLLCIIAHHLVLFFLEAFKLSEIGYTLIRCGLSVIFTVLLILLIEFIFYKRTSR
ncbi:rod shape-determining protein MreD [Pedobacter changchengzhani]|uniref:Rod shape-determining protein MreD n=1 Tax=Pedobacter changchengzhani TaxID=2529274 RepID=A0A4R5MM77_9SPHI|nr:rod shape-determining protein MreD [Pedobacter changchengzhani]TDG36768.1 rod shape-determining protein MreD [Pedobacter changchengzhani]